MSSKYPHYNTHPCGMRVKNAYDLSLSVAQLERIIEACKMYDAANPVTLPPDEDPAYLDMYDIHDIAGNLQYMMDTSPPGGGILHGCTL